MDPLVTAGIITAGANIVGGGAQAFTGSKMNKKTRFHQLRMYERQLADNRENWRIQNEYNSPAAQMERLKAAGLNPHMAQGQGNTGGAIETPPMESTPFYEPDMSFIGKAGESLAMGFYNKQKMDLAVRDMEIKDKQLQLKSNEDVRAQEMQYYDVLEKMLKIDKSTLDNDIARTTKDGAIQMVYDKLNGLQADNKRKDIQNRMLEAEENRDIRRWETELKELGTTDKLQPYIVDSAIHVKRMQQLTYDEAKKEADRNGERWEMEQKDWLDQQEAVKQAMKEWERNSKNISAEEFMNTKIFGNNKLPDWAKMGIAMLVFLHQSGGTQGVQKMYMPPPTQRYPSRIEYSETTDGDGNVRSRTHRETRVRD